MILLFGGLDLVEFDVGVLVDTVVIAGPQLGVAMALMSSTQVEGCWGNQWPCRAD